MSLSRDQKIGAFFLLFAVLLVFVWVPLDVDSGYTVQVRRQVSVGDAFAPTIAGVFVLIGGLFLLVFGGTRDEPQEPIDFLALRFAGLLFAVYVLSFMMMLFVGPIAVLVSNLLTGMEQEYRLLRDAAPWKYLGFAVGCTFAITSTISLLEGRFSLRAVLIGLCAVLAMIAIYDLPFDDLLLPPNGDV
ncbi:hypothetical protein I5535_20510 [Rhodobacteraceae bacterium F11138]|nr:hypothetical protein [Rhodobacteraceae bacterium F11138]